MYKFLYDETILRKWFEFMYDSWWGIDNKPLEYESIFFSLAARNKLLKDKQLDINLNKTFMFDRSIFSGKNFDSCFENFLIKIRKLERNEGSYKTKRKSNNNELIDLPNEAMVIYFNINPVNNLKAFLLLKDMINNIESELWKTSINKKSNENCIKDISRLDYLVEKSYGKSESNKRWFDIDVDIINKDYQNELFENILTIIKNTYNYNKLYVVKTNEGIHIGFNTSLLKSTKSNPQQIFDNIKKLLNISLISEIKINKNGILPLPGTKHGNIIVDFKFI